MKPYAELLEFNQPNPIRKSGFTRIRDSFEGLSDPVVMVHKGRSVGISTATTPVSRFFNPECISEFAGRWDYGAKNAAKLGQMSKKKTVTLRDPATDEGREYEDVPIIQKWIESGEQSMLEMGHATVFIECSRVVSHELVRHRLASFQQESQRFTKLDGGDLTAYYFPDELKDDDQQMTFDAAVQRAFASYEILLDQGVPKQIARYVLPNATRTRMIVSANMREWRHIIKLRLHPSAQPEMRELMQQIYDQLVEVFPQSLEGVLEEGRGVR